MQNKIKKVDTKNAPGLNWSQALKVKISYIHKFTESLGKRQL